MTEKKRRSDYGQIRIAERDIYLLTFIGEQYAIRTDQLHLMMNRWKRTHEPDWKGPSLSQEAVKWLLKRWRKAGWVEYRKLLAHQPQWVLLTKKGLEEMGLDYPYRKPAVSRLEHIFLVNAVRLYMEKKLGDELVWVSERQVKAERKAEGRKHMVDGEAIYQNTVIGIEVERTAKTPRRLASIVYELETDYEAVWYFVNEATNLVVKTAIGQREGTANQKDWRRFVIYQLAQVLVELGPS